MKKVTQWLVVLTMLFLSTGMAHAQESTISDKAAEVVEVEDVSPMNDVDCANVMNEIFGQINALGECWENSDCVVVNFGCPWQEGPCHHSLASVNEQDEYTKIMQAIKQFNIRCLPNNAKMKKQCDWHQKMQSKSRCVAQNLVCLRGRCVTENEVIYQQRPEGVARFGETRTEAKNRSTDVDDPKGSLREYLESKGIKMDAAAEKGAK